MRRSRLAAGIAVATMLTVPAPAAATHVGDVNCGAFTWQEDAQAHLDAHPGDPDNLDRDGDGDACEWLPRRGTPAPPQPGPPQPPSATAYYKTPHAAAVYAVDAGARTVRAISFEEWARAGYPAPAPAPTDFVKYPWSPTIYAVTFWFPNQEAWQWDQLGFEQWSLAGFPAPRTAGWIADSYYYKWATADELFVEGRDGVNHKMTYQEWADSGFRPFDARDNEGFGQVAGEATITRYSDLSTGVGRPIGFDEWREEAFPSPRVQQP